ncbi:hypothetical protein [Mucilaginibacter sp. NFX135]|uniref:hypothetical protein n=1 Tax=Mucilaginibacter sp. NFX135 TaxID=3402687 RepID=UPI003AFA9CEB
MAAGGPITFVATKVTKKAVSREASLPHVAFALQTGQNHGLQLFALLRTAQFPASAKLAMPLQPHKPPLFCPLSPEAYLLTGRKGKKSVIVMR